ncbi:hypothetical protein FS935_00065 [Metabacillus litoralis]|uniref:Uncharacterized protein n=1 Tax=Metabacillus litoralis TaxID=152268 RepID=A0A5C6W3Z0_9BACI|nr:hypothetical protein [Metabacillus litoralis]TXC92646.1 hypothetical protein FS935_00065 [Metabacillus litoralis]
MFIGQSMEFLLIDMNNTMIRLDIFYYIDRDEYKVLASVKNKKGLIVSGKEKEEVVNRAFSNLKDELV